MAKIKISDFLKDKKPKGKEKTLQAHIDAILYDECSKILKSHGSNWKKFITHCCQTLKNEMK